MTPEAEDLSSSKDEDSEDENQLTNMFKEPEHLLSDEHNISGLVENIEARNSPISLQFLTSVQDNQVNGPSTSNSPPAILDHPILQTIATMPTVDLTMDGQFTVDAPMTQAGQKVESPGLAFNFGGMYMWTGSIKE